MKDLRRQLESFLNPDQILDNRLYREIYSRDASYFNIRPGALVRPRTVAQIERLIALCKNQKISLTFRTGGTSLSGQSLGSGIVCELRTGWDRCVVRDSGNRVWFEPGVTADQVNASLRGHHRHIGPDPASASAAMMGGILSNNSSGMSAGVTYNSYHTLSAIEFILPDGHRYNSASREDILRFESEEKELCAGLKQIRSEILADEEVRNKIERKYRIKNVTGYSMNAFLDFDTPMDIFTHLLIGSEGTLAYIVSGELKTLPLDNVYSSAMLYFDSVTSAGAQAAWLGESGARCVEMMDYASLRSYIGEKLDMPVGTTVLLIDYGADSSDMMADKTSVLAPKLAALPGLLKMDDFTHTVEHRDALWQMRNGIFPCVAGVRTPGATVILEDVVSPVERLDKLVGGVSRLFDKYDYNGAIFGHARDGNIHPLLTTPISSTADVERFRHFMDDFVDHVLSLDGSLKGEHGTGRAIAPFVEKEWGEKIYAYMRRVKQLADPDGVLNPGVIINDNPDCFMQDLKPMHLFGKGINYEKADTCIECGYCEHVCPTRGITLTPRQRIQALRVLEANPGLKDMEKEFRFDGTASCCADGSCQVPCPMSISTAIITDALREKSIPGMLRSTLTKSAEHYATAESAIRGALKAAVLTEKVISPYPLIWATDFLHRISDMVPHWSKHFPMPAKLHYNEVENPDFLYFPACVTRIFGASSTGKDDLITIVLRVADRGGVKVSIPKEMHGLCCSQIWEHKGDPEGKKIAANKIVERFYALSDGGRIPIFCDTTSCTHTLLTSMTGSLTPENLDKYSRLKIKDILEWLDEDIMPRLKVTHPKRSVLLHPTCASRILNLQQRMVNVAEKCAEEATVPFNAYCCGAAGDRGFIYPQVARAATAPEREEIGTKQYDGYYSLARTCEMSMMDTIGRPYEHIIYLVDETTSD